jgi:esterase
MLHAIERGSGPPLALLHGLFGHAGNFGAVQRELARKFRVLALDLRNHGQSPHAEDMRYATLAEDVLETLRARDALPCALLGHSMGGKAAMTLALTSSSSVSRLIVADVAPVSYGHGMRRYVDAMRGIPLVPDLTRAVADAALAEEVPDTTMRGFLLQNLRFGERASWRFGLNEIAAAMPGIEGWPDVTGRYDGPALFFAGARSDYILLQHRPAIRALFPAARFVTLKDAGHWLHADNPAGFVAVVEAFLGDY